jgi:lysyl-tRNA synthetase class 2
MKPVAVESTILTMVAYDADRALLQLGFRDQDVYCYFDVPVDVHENLLRASSKGSYFNRFIRGRFAYARVSADSLS